MTSEEQKLEELKLEEQKIEEQKIEEQNLKELIFKEFNTNNILSAINSTIDTSTIEHDVNFIYNNMFINYYEPKNKRKNEYKVFYYKYRNVQHMLIKSYIMGHIKLTNPFPNKINITLTHLSNISDFGFVLIKTLVEHIENELQIDNKLNNKLININDKFLNCCKSLRKVDYRIHKHLSSTRYPALSILKLDIVIILDNEIKRAKRIYKINCEKIFDKIQDAEKLNNTFTWFNNNSISSYAKFLPIKTTVGEKTLFDVIPENTLKYYKIDELSANIKDKYCLVYNTHFETKMIYKFKLKNNIDASAYCENDNICDDNLIFNSCISEEDIEQQLEIFKSLNMLPTKEDYEYDVNTLPTDA